MVAYYTGTGNSRYVAQRFAAALGDDLITANEYIKNDTTAGRSRTSLPIFCAAAASPAARRLTLS